MLVTTLMDSSPSCLNRLFALMAHGLGSVGGSQSRKRNRANCSRSTESLAITASGQLLLETNRRVLFLALATSS